jgi:hypothetical protein
MPVDLLDLMDPPDLAGWEERALADMAAGPLTYCYLGFMGSICERLVARGMAVSEDAGFMAAPGKIRGYDPREYPLRRYSVALSW